LTFGIEAAERVLQQANSAVDRELRNEALADLCARVDDWKNHDVDQFGDLLLHGQFTVVTGKSDIEKEVGFSPYFQKLKASLVHVLFHVLGAVLEIYLTSKLLTWRAFRPLLM
jgi:hypothetical protein